MLELHECWDPNEWETHVFRLLRDRHGALHVMKVPARHKGDCGLDYYCLADRVAYQCYAVQEPCEVARRAEKQKAKITLDLNKFCRKRADVPRLFRDVLILRWILVVPIHDSAQVNIHLTSKTMEVRRLGLPYVAHDFEVLIHDLDSFDADSRAYRASQRRLLSLPSQAPTHEEIMEWAGASNPLVSNLSRKLRKRIDQHDSEKLQEAVREAIGWFLERDNALETLRQRTPELHEAIFGVV